MAQLLIPLLFAGAGYAAFGTMMAFSIGWLIGSWIYSAFFAEEAEVFDPGAEEMPRINQSLRGFTMAVSFGTVRLSPNIIWVNDFQSIRHEEESGGGKAKKGGGSKTVSYTYTWDAIFHFGMVPQPYTIYRGWKFSDELTADTISSIVFGNGNFWIEPENAAEGPVSMTYEDSFFAPGGASNNGNFNTWDYFETEMGYALRWPNTVWVGFQALDLGETTNLPQLSFEIGPGEPIFEPDTGFVSSTSGLGSIGNSYTPSGINGFVTGEDGELYYFFGKHATSFQWIRVSDGQLQTLTLATFNADAATRINNTPYGNIIGAFGVAGTPYFYAMASEGAFVSTVGGLLYRIDSNGNAVVEAGGFSMRSDSPVNNVCENVCMFSRCSSTPNEGEETDELDQNHAKPVILHTKGGSGSNHAYLTVIPSINSMKLFGAGPIDAVGDRSWDDAEADLSTLDLDGITDYGYGEFGGGIGFVVPTLSIVGGLIVLAGARMYVYVSKARIQKNIDSPTCQYITDMQGTYPDGFMFYVSFGVMGVEPGFVSFSGPHLDMTTFSAIPFDSDGFKADGVTPSTNYQDAWSAGWQAIDVDNLAPFATAVIAHKFYVNHADDHTGDNVHMDLRAWVWNPFEQTTFALGEKTADVPVTFLGIDTPEDMDWSQVFFDPSGENIYWAGRQGGNNYISQVGALQLVNSGVNANIAYIIYTILTSTVFGMGVSEDAIDQASYLNAYGFCELNNYKVSVTYTRNESFLSVINELLALYGGYLTESGGVIKFGVVELSSTPVRTLDNDHLVIEEKGTPPVTITRAARQDSSNIVKVNYLDRNLAYRQNIYEIADEVDVDLNGPRAKEFPAKFVMDEETAAKIGARTLWSNLYGRDILDFKLTWKDADLEPGDVVTLVDSFHQELSTGRKVRIVAWKEDKFGLFAVRAVNEIDYISAASGAFYNVSSPGSSRQLVDEEQAPLDFRAYELPREFQGGNAYVYFGYNQGHAAMGAKLWLSPDDVSYVEADDEQPYIISGMFPEALPARDVGYCEQDLQIYLMPLSGFSAASPTWAQTHALDPFTQALRSTGGTMLIAGSEAMAAEGLTLVSQNTYKVDKLWRGYGGTPIQAHNSGAYWHKHGSGVFFYEINTDKIGQRLYYKIAPYNFAHVGYNISSIVGKSYDIRGHYWIPQGPAQLRTFVQSTVQGTASQDLYNKTTRLVTSGGCDVTFTWPDAARAEGFGAGGYGAGGYGHYAADTSSPTWRVQVLSNDLSTVVRCTTVSTGFYTYGRATNSADFNGWKGGFAVRVIPYNNYGLALYSKTQSLVLFTE